MYCSPALTQFALELNPGTVTEVAASLDCGIHQNAKMIKDHIYGLAPCYAFIMLLGTRNLSSVAWPIP